MNVSKVGLRYAKAVLQQATDDNNIKDVFADMTSIQETLAGSKELRTTLQSPVIKASDKQAILASLFSGSTATTQNEGKNKIRTTHKKKINTEEKGRKKK